MNVQEQYRQKHEESNIGRLLLMVARRFIDFPFSKICVHSAAIEVLNVYNRIHPLPEELIRSVYESSAGDMDTLRILEEMLARPEPDYSI